MHVHDLRSYDPVGHAERMRAKRRERDRLQKARRYATDPTFRARKLAYEGQRYSKPEIRERHKARQRVESMTPERIEQKRAEARARHWREREARREYLRSYRSSPDYNAKRRACTLTKAILREVCDLLRAGPARQVEGRRRRFEPCPRAALVVTADLTRAIPSAMLRRRSRDLKMSHFF